MLDVVSVVRGWKLICKQKCSAHFTSFILIVKIVSLTFRVSHHCPLLKNISSDEVCAQLKYQYLLLKVVLISRALHTSHNLTALLCPHLHTLRGVKWLWLQCDCGLTHFISLISTLSPRSWGWEGHIQWNTGTACRETLWALIHWELLVNKDSIRKSVISCTLSCYTEMSVPSTVSQPGLNVVQEKECLGWMCTNHTQSKLGSGQQVMTWEEKRVLTGRRIRGEHRLGGVLLRKQVSE